MYLGTHDDDAQFLSYFLYVHPTLFHSSHSLPKLNPKFDFSTFCRLFSFFFFFFLTTLFPYIIPVKLYYHHPLKKIYFTCLLKMNQYTLKLGAPSMLRRQSLIVMHLKPLRLILFVEIKLQQLRWIF